MGIAKRLDRGLESFRTDREMNRREFNQTLLLGSAGAAVPLKISVEDPLRVNGSRLNANLKALSELGKNELGGVSRVAYSEADLQGRELALKLMQSAGLKTKIDAAGNLVGSRSGSDSTLPPLVTGSHIDSVPEGGNYDGDVGSMGAIEVAHRLHEARITTRHPLEVIIFANEEGGQTGSRAIGGRLTEKDLDRVSHSKKTLREGIRFIGGDPSRIIEVRRKPGDVFAFIELHIEQGPILDAEGINIGIVEGIVGIHRWMVTITGFANHAGTTPMDRRQDALLAAARLIDRVNRIVTSLPGKQVGTVGWIEASPGAPNVVAGRVRLTLEMRDLDWTKIDHLFERIKESTREISRESGTDFHFEEIYANPPRLTEPPIQDLIERVAQRLKLSVKRLPSGAGHDAQSLSHIVPMGMIFVPSSRGISHSAEEFTRPDDVTNGADVLLQTILILDRTSQV